MNENAEVSERIVDAALRLAAEQGWRNTSLGEIAAEAGVPLADLHQHFRSRGAILLAFYKRLDRAVMQTDFDPEETVRDRLFDAVMRRFEAMQPHRQAVRQILREPAADPVSAYCAARRFMRSMALILEAAGLSTSGLRGAVRTQAMAAVYSYALREWLRDETPDMSKTMAALDRALARAEGLAAIAEGIARGGRRRGAQPPPEEPEPPPTPAPEPGGA